MLLAHNYVTDQDISAFLLAFNETFNFDYTTDHFWQRTINLVSFVRCHPPTILTILAELFAV